MPTITLVEILGFSFYTPYKDTCMRVNPEKHRHCTIMKLYADNKNLTVLVRLSGYPDWTTASTPTFNVAHDYFLCLPKHTDPLLHMLNGGEAEVATTDGWQQIHSDCLNEFDLDWWYMSEEYESRIKPKTETRWAAYYKGTILPFTSKEKEEILNHYTIDNAQFIEFTLEIPNKE